MRKGLFLFCPLLFGSLLLFLKNQTTEAFTENYQQEKQLTAIGCAPGADDYTADATGKFIQVLPGWGNHSYSISTSIDSAQLYFNQGLTMYYSYHSREAVASFREAARFDSTNAMLYWAQALALWGHRTISGMHIK
jgi:hypothetical protein